MSEKPSWVVAGLITVGIIYAGVKFYPPILTALHVFVCLLLIVVVLLQSGRAADLAGAFGGAGSQTAFGPRGAATLLSKATTFLAIVFMVTSLTLAIYASSPSRSAAEEAAQPPPAQTGQAGPSEESESPPAESAPGEEPASPSQE